MKVLFTGGGTGGHVSPAIAIAEILEKYGIFDECLFVGRDGGDENKAIINKGYALQTVKVSSIPRKLSLKTAVAVSRLLRAKIRAKRLIRAFAPDVVVATGGYVSYPILTSAIRMKLPTLIHESNAYPGLVTRRLGPKCNKVLLGMDSAKEYLTTLENVSVSGNPVRSDFGKMSYSSARRMLGISDSEKLIVSFGGSGGADKINEVMIDMMIRYSNKKANIKHVHAVGRRSFSALSEVYPELTDEEKAQRVKIIPYIENMAVILSACDLAIARSGAMTVAELERSGTPAILIPSPNVSANHQYYNALYAKKKFGAVIIEERDLTADALWQEAYTLMNSSLNNQRAKRSKSTPHEGSCDKIIKDAIVEIAGH